MNIRIFFISLPKDFLDVLSTAGQYTFFYFTKIILKLRTFIILIGLRPTNS